MLSREKYDVLRLTVDFSRTTGTAPQVLTTGTDLYAHFTFKFQRETATLKSGFRRYAAQLPGRSNGGVFVVQFAIPELPT